MPLRIFTSRIPICGGAGVGRQDAVVRQARREFPENPLRVDRIGAGHRAGFDGLPPFANVGLDRLPPGAIGFAFQVGNQCFERLLRVPFEVHVHRITDAEHAAIDVDLHGLGLALFWKEFGIGEAGADHEESVAILHHVPAWLGAEQPDAAGAEGDVIRDDGLAQPRLGHPAAEDVGDFDHFFAGRERPAPTSIATFLPALRTSAAARSSGSCGIMNGTGKPMPE